MRVVLVPSGAGTREDERRRDEVTIQDTTVVKDPVCGMDVETASAAGRTDYKGQTYYFCGSKCKEKFDHNQEQYVGKSEGTPKSGHGCCG
jgi:Cu+-exporting ATPase